VLNHRQSAPRFSARKDCVDSGELGGTELEGRGAGVLGHVCRAGRLGDHEHLRVAEQEPQRDLSGGLRGAPWLSPRAPCLAPFAHRTQFSIARKACTPPAQCPVFGTRAEPRVRLRVPAGGTAPDCTPDAPRPQSPPLRRGRRHRNYSRPRTGSCRRAPACRRRQSFLPTDMRRASEAGVAIQPIGSQACQ